LVESSLKSEESEMKLYLLFYRIALGSDIT